MSGLAWEISGSEGPSGFWLPFPNRTLSPGHFMDSWQWGWKSWSQVQILKTTRALESEHEAQIPPMKFINSCHFGGVKALPHLSTWAQERSNFCSLPETPATFKGNGNETAL